MHVSVMFMPPLNASFFFLSPLPTNCEGSVPCFQIPRLGSVSEAPNCLLQCIRNNAII